MSRPSAASRVRRPRSARVRSPEAELAARDEAMLLAAARAAFNAGLLDEPREPTALALSGEPSGYSLPPSPVERVVIQNWKPEAGFVPIGDVELELQPGQAVTLWVGRGAPTPMPRDTDVGVSGSLAILWDDEPLLG